MQSENDRGFNSAVAVDFFNSYRFARPTVMERRMIGRLVTPGARVLELGCGTGRVTPAIAAAGARVLGADIAPNMVAEARRRHPELSFEVADAAAMPFAGGSFDVVFFFANGLDFVYPLARRHAAFAEIARVLRPGGALAFTSRNALCVLPYPLHLKEIVQNALWGSLFDRYRRIEGSHGPLLTHFADPRALQVELGRWFADVEIESCLPLAHAAGALLLRALDPFPFFVCTTARSERGA
jgi:ubiquinone/menaquinone biosynthesis C-methylase UbiE